MILGVFLLVTIVVSILQYMKHPMDNGYTSYNNFIIFRNSFYHLIHNGDLYSLWPKEHFDYYKYSPSFPIFMLPFTWLPDLPGLIAWNLLNALSLFFALRALPALQKNAAALMQWFVLLELITSMQNSQSNGLMAGLMIGGFALIERKNIFIGILLIVLSAYIKIFSLAALLLCLFYPARWKMALTAIAWTVTILLLPLFVIDAEQLRFLYQSWFHLLANDHDASIGISVLGWLQSWFRLNPDKTVVALSGVILLLAPFVQFQKWRDLNFRINALASVLIWVVIFNHKAESPTYVIAVAGIAIWFFKKPWAEVPLADKILVFSVILFTCLSPTDLFPRTIRNSFIVPYSLKAIPCILIWLKIGLEMIVKNKIMDQDGSQY